MNDRSTTGMLGPAAGAAGRAGEAASGEYRCASCGYGVSAQRTLPRCPMCGGATWEQRPPGRLRL